MSKTDIMGASPRDTADFTSLYRGVLTALIAGAALPLLDTTVVGVAIPRLTGEFGASVTTLQWIATGYTLAAAAIVPVCAWATKRLGARRLWIGGLALFAIGSLATGMAQTVPELIVFRVVQGLGAGILTAVMQSVLIQALGREKLKPALTAIALPSVLAPIAGPILGSAFIAFGNWRLIFFINVPIALLGIVLAFWRVPADTRTRSVPFDWVGLILSVPGLGLMLYGLVLVGETRTFAGTPGVALAAGLVLLLLFSVITLRRKAAPFVELRLFAVRSFSASAGLLFLSSMLFYGGIFILPLIFMKAFSLTILQTGLYLGLQSLGALVARKYISVLSDRFGVRGSIWIALSAAMLGTALLLWPHLQADPLLLGAAMVIRGAGVGFTTLLAMSHAYEDVAADHVPDASSLTRVVTLLGASISTALVAIFFSAGIAGAGHVTAILALLVGAALCFAPALALPARDRQAAKSA